MQQHRPVGPDVFTEDPLMSEFAKAIANEENIAVTIHKNIENAGIPNGSIVERWVRGQRKKFVKRDGKLVPVK